jgi:BMFP domain-containing protein YqiC
VHQNGSPNRTPLAHIYPFEACLNLFLTAPPSFFVNKPKMGHLFTLNGHPFMQKPGQILEQIQRIAEDMQSKVGDAIRNSPAQEIEKNVRAMMNQGFQKMDLVTREEFELQAKVLSKTREKLEALEMKVAEMEKRHA